MRPLALFSPSGHAADPARACPPTPPGHSTEEGPGYPSRGRVGCELSPPSTLSPKSAPWRERGQRLLAASRHPSHSPDRPLSLSHSRPPSPLPPPFQAALPPLIPLEFLYAGPLATDPELSPDGAWVSYLAPAGKDNALNVWVGPVNNSAPVRSLTAEGPWDMAAGQFQWSADSRFILYLYDRGGGSRFRLYRQALNGSAPVDLLPRLGSPRPSAGELASAGASGRPAPVRAPALNITASASPSADGRGVWGAGMRVAELFLSPGAPDEALVTVDARAPDLFDVWRLNLTSGRLVADVENPGDVVSWVPDASLHVRGARAARPGGWSVLRVRGSVHGPGSSGDPAAASGNASAWPAIATWGPGDVVAPISAPGQSGAAFTADGAGLWVLSSLGLPSARLQRLSTADGAVLESVPPPPGPSAAADADVVEVIIDPASGQPTAAASDYLRRAWAPLTAGGAADVAALTAAFNGSGDWSILSTTADGVKSAVKLVSDTSPPVYYYYDRATPGNASAVRAGVPELANLAAFRLAPQAGVTVPARDGLGLPCYLTLPAGLQGAAAANATGGLRLPLVIAVRPSPWGRERWGFSSTVQMLANRGYAVLQVNSRGATGFGKAFAAAGAGGWAGAMLDDYEDAAAWATGPAGVGDPRRVHVVGRGYGGYSALALATMRPATFDGCAASYGGPPLLRSPAVMWPGGLMQPVTAGALNVTTPEAAAALTPEAAAAAAAAASPATHVAGLRLRGLLMGAGGRDDPSLLASTRAFATAAAEGNASAGAPPVPDVRLVVYANLAGAALRTDEDRLDWGSRGEQFMASCAGGRAGPALEVAGAKVEVVRGPGLGEGGGAVRRVDPDELRAASKIGT